MFFWGRKVATLRFEAVLIVQVCVALIMVEVRTAQYEESMRYAITLLNVAITILLAIHEQILKCTNFCHSAAKILI